jgi:hypothetical protein
MKKVSRSPGLNRRELLWSSALLGSSALLFSSTATAQNHCELPIGAQGGWRYCHRCKGLFYSPSGARAGACPAGLGGHDASLSYNYALSHGYCPNEYSQNGWRWCRKCQGIAYATSPAGRCAAGNRHDHRDSFNYLMSTWYGASDNPQSGWVWCSNCQGLHYHPTFESPFGWCPNGGRHVSGGSWPYLVGWGI